MTDECQLKNYYKVEAEHMISQTAFVSIADIEKKWLRALRQTGGS